MNKAVSFVYTNNDKWGLSKQFIDNNLVGIPLTNPNIPVISCIGTSRDGKSTLLNSIYKRITNGPNTPFVSKNGTDMVTNGIDYLLIPNECVLLDCQGMALKDAKYDHFLTLIVYLLSNVIVLHVRQQLDLQVLNNLLAVFSFLSELPDEAKRKDKPTLIIRIKDFQDTEKLEKEGSQYLSNYVKKWLTKSGDQYDHIKEAFMMTFNIQIVVTEYPEFTDKKSKTIDIHDKNFFVNNSSYSEACDKIIAISKDYKAVELLKDKNKLIKLINNLNANTNIDYKKLDLYHNVTSLELERYVNESLNILPYNDTTLIDKMDGTLKAYECYLERSKQLYKLQHYTYFEKFKEVTNDLKKEILDKWFVKFDDIVNKCREKNIMLANQIIKPFLDNFNNKFKLIESTNDFTRLMNDILGIFYSSKIELYKHLEFLDINVQKEIIAQLNKEEDDLIKKQEEIKFKNDQVQLMIRTLVKNYDSSKKIRDYITLEIEQQINQNQYNISFQSTRTIITNKIRSELFKIHEDNKKIYFLNSSRQIDTNNNMNYDLNVYMPNEKEYDIYWDIKNKYFTNLIFLKNICTDTNFGIKFVIFILANGTNITMTYDAYKKFHKDVVIKICNKFKIFDNLLYIDDINYDKTNVCNLQFKFPKGWEVNNYFHDAVNYKFYKYLILFANKEKVIYVAS